MFRRYLCMIRCSVAVLFLTLMAGASHAQVLYGSLTGNVADPSGSVIPGATVEARSVGTGISRKAITDNRGSYAFNDVAQGAYDMTVTAKGFQTIVEKNVSVTVNEVRRVDFSTKIS